ncbi:beta-ketoacyl synthase N-terminal-like domain-containing protein [Streptomyces sp. NPDC023723]|uniref:beta-ketoacyl synthase N-terminal-like domain-containing protein n=1 Tax=Streptomyces sp. NPDC023723 TaxID=3154323 RepID=UPI0033C57500
MAEHGRRRVAVTGLGAISSLGHDADSVVNAIRSGQSGVAPIERFDSTGFERLLAGEVRGFAPARHLKSPDAPHWGRSAQLAAAAARGAVLNSGISPEFLSQERTVSCFGTTNGESQAMERLSAQWVEGAGEQLDPRLIPQVDPGSISTAVSVELALGGAAVT